MGPYKYGILQLKYFYKRLCLELHFNATKNPQQRGPTNRNWKFRNDRYTRQHTTANRRHFKRIETENLIMDFTDLNNVVYQAIPVYYRLYVLKKYVR